MQALRDISFLSVLVRMLCAMACGAFIGVERESEGKDAGLRTHIMICLGAAMVSATSVYFVTVLHQYTDIARLGAQVIAGLGFIGAGCIVVTRYRRIRGLTTAAGLWVTGIIGLCCGAGFYEGGLLTTVLLHFGIKGIANIEKKYFNTTPSITMYIAFENKKDLRDIMEYFRDVDVKVQGFYIDREPEEMDKPYGFFELKLHRKITPDDIITDLRAFGFALDVRDVTEK